VTLIPWYSSVTGRFGVAGGVETEGLCARDTVASQIVVRQTEKKVLMEALSERLTIILPGIMEGKLWRLRLRNEQLKFAPSLNQWHIISKP
jgi:hypothetical protein